MDLTHVHVSIRARVRMGIPILTTWPCLRSEGNKKWGSDSLPIFRCLLF